MPPIEVGPARAISAIEARLARSAGTGNPASEARDTGPMPVEGAMLARAGEPPVDSERVAMIRRAVETGAYPIVPARIADAIIAAGMMLRRGE